MAISKTVCQVSGCFHLIRADTASKDCGANVKTAFLFLRMDADVIAINVCRWVFDLRRIEPIAEALLDLILKALGCPSVAKEEEFQACPLAVLAQVGGVAKDFCDRANYGNNLALVEERVDPRRKEWVS